MSCPEQLTSLEQASGIAGQPPSLSHYHYCYGVEPHKRKQPCTEPALSTCVYINMMLENADCSDKSKRKRQILIAHCSSVLLGVMVNCNLLIPLCSDFSNLLSDIH
ncbi:hypothetical protein T4E_11617 [Trichinella pseudospiralis]|uniref:Uncharacterized protein n=1 Tax=Trichinella pseudospiralis TaxID=6337 RepID=A0A0V0XE55_TRIPS|nr:hypothetical protein T4E_11617 [Trichinella pseudospiralis]